jgi:hypothetical protein
VFRIDCGDPDGADLTYKDNAIVFIVPESGVVKVRDAKWADKNLQFRACFDDGTEIPWAIPGDSISEDRIALWTLFARSDNSIWFLVGTPADRRRCNRSDIKPGRIVIP